MADNLKRGGMVKQIIQMQKQLKQAQKELEKEVVIGTAGGGTVSVIFTGSQKCKGVKLDGEKISALSKNDLEKLLEQAILDALEKSRKLMVEKLGPLSGGFSGLKI